MDYKEIDRAHWTECRICGMKTENMKKPHAGPTYLGDKFKTHVESLHGLFLHDYFTKHCLLPMEMCQCGCGKPVMIRVRGRKLLIGRYIRWHSTANDPEFMASAARMKTERLGKGNPAFGKPSWNKGLTKETSPVVEKIASKLRGKQLSETHRLSISRSWKTRTVMGHTTPHSEATRKRLSEITLENIRKGIFTQTKSRPHIVFSAILDELKIRYEEEKTVGCWSFDFYLIDERIYVEVDGDYFHSNPLFYPNGPKTATQKVNHYRDGKKNYFAASTGMKLIRFWETDILNRRDWIIENLKGHLDALGKNHASAGAGNASNM